MAVLTKGMQFYVAVWWNEVDMDDTEIVFRIYNKKTQSRNTDVFLNAGDQL